MKFKVYYYRSLGMLLETYGHECEVTLDRLPETHIFVKEVEASYHEQIFWQMQSENWSPNGEARPLIRELGLTHTSMSVGDVLQDEAGDYWQCADVGWRKPEL